MRLDDLIAANLHTLTSGPPRKPPACKPVKTGGPGETPQSKPVVRSALTALPVTSKPEKTSERPPYADDIDSMVADMLARGDIARDKQTGEYLILYRRFKFERS
jgi:hypothetical protein